MANPPKPCRQAQNSFRTQHGLFQLKRMPFGLSAAGSTFQGMANNIFNDLIQQGVMLVYLDDILIHIYEWPQYLQVLQEVLKMIRRYNL